MGLEKSLINQKWQHNIIQTTSRSLRKPKTSMAVQQQPQKRKDKDKNRKIEVRIEEMLQWSKSTECRYSLSVKEREMKVNSMQGLCL